MAVISPRELLEHSRESEYFSVGGLRTLTGLTENKWDYAILKELLDNALDAVNDLDEKLVSVQYDGVTLRISDNGSGISPDALDKVHDFSVYVSNKHDFHTPTRGMQGNALKTIIGICVLRGYTLSFFTNFKAYRYVINKTLLDAGIVRFDKHVEPSDVDRSCVVVQFIECGENGDPETKTNHDYVGITYDIIKDLLWKLHLANPDVTFTFNGDTVFEAVEPPKRYTEKTFIHWYDFAKFNQLLQAVVVKDPNRTVKDFCLKFSGTQRILSKLKFPYKRLSEFNNDPAAIKLLLKELKAKTKQPRPEILNGMLSGESAFMSMFRARARTRNNEGGGDSYCDSYSSSDDANDNDDEQDGAFYNE